MQGPAPRGTDISSGIGRIGKRLLLHDHRSATLLDNILLVAKCAQARHDLRMTTPSIKTASPDDHKAMRRWVGNKFDPETRNHDEINKAIAKGMNRSEGHYRFHRESARY